MALLWHYRQQQQQRLADLGVCALALARVEKGLVHKITQKFVCLFPY